MRSIHLRPPCRTAPRVCFAMDFTLQRAWGQEERRRRSPRKAAATRGAWRWEASGLLERAHLASGEEVVDRLLVSWMQPRLGELAVAQMDHLHAVVVERP